ncbi:hypothetical protein [Hymenobacter sp. 102]|uniref:hypothetical protein n=1 Tax=Hymenobacter sp. 102 TaxID=3403152 RepID=UPI003CF6C890
MKQEYSFTWGRPAAGALLIMLLGSAVAGCNNDAEILPNPGPEYYPLAVGAYRIYDVADTTWRNNVPTASRFQFREQVAAELTPDATGQPVYRVIRSRRATATDAWAVDSVLTVTVGKNFLTEQRSNRRSVELVFPVVENKSWSNTGFYAPDTAKQVNREPTRFYRAVGEPFTIASGTKQFSYENTVTVTNDLSTPFIFPTDPGGPNINNKTTNIVRATFAKGIGPVYRYKRSIDHCSINGGSCDRRNFIIGQSRREVLVESGQ